MKVEKREGSITPSIASSSSTTLSVMTSTSTEAGNPGLITTTTNRDAVPWDGATYIIRDMHHPGRVINLSDGILQLSTISEIDLLSRSSSSGSCGWDWICIERDGWMGFRNRVAGTYIGHNGKGKFCARAEKHLEFESFCVRRHPDGGYLLLVRHGANKLRRMEVAEDEVGLVEREEGGSVWEFVKV